MTKERRLPTKRLASLSPHKEMLLAEFTAFVDNHLISCSHEKRGVAMLVTADIVRLCPPELIPIALSRSMVRCLLSARVNRKHTLHGIATRTIKNILLCAGDQSIMSFNCYVFD